MTLRLCWVALSFLLLVPAAQMEDLPDYPGLPFVFYYQGRGASSWICCVTAPSAACIKSHGMQDCPPCSPCLPPISSHDNEPYTTPRYSPLHNYFRGKPYCKGGCHIDGSGYKPSSLPLEDLSEQSDDAAVPLQNRGRPASPVRPPKQSVWQGPPLPPRNQPPPRPPPVPPRPPRGRK